MTTPRTLTRISAGIVLSSLFAAVALAGPGPQYWNRPAAKTERKPGPAPKAETAPVATCEGCKTTPLWVAGNREPAGKGTPRMYRVGTKHDCNRCTGAIVNENGKAKTVMTHSAACSPLACCK